MSEAPPPPSPPVISSLRLLVVCWFLAVGSYRGCLLWIGTRLLQANSGKCVSSPTALRNWLVQIVFRRERNNQTATQTYPIDPCSHNFTSIPSGKNACSTVYILWVDFLGEVAKNPFHPIQSSIFIHCFCRRIGAECLNVGSSVDST